MVHPNYFSFFASPGLAFIIIERCKKKIPISDDWYRHRVPYCTELFGFELNITVCEIYLIELIPHGCVSKVSRVPAITAGFYFAR